MIEPLVTFFIYMFDLFIIKIFLDNTLRVRRHAIPLPVHYACFIIMEMILLSCQHLYEEHFSDDFKSINVLVSLLTTFQLCYLYDSPLKHRIFISVSFQAFSLFSELIFTTIVMHIRPAFTEHITNSLINFMNFGSKIVLFLLIQVFIFFWNRYFSRYRLQYNLLLMITPLMTIFILLFVPIRNYLNIESSDFNLILILCLTIFNIANYMLLENTFKTAELSYEYGQMRQQIEFQKEKYRQLSTAYKNTRSVVHDTKKHYLTMQELINRKDYDRLNGYLFTACENLESTYARYNTGNLVIDSMMTNYKNIAEQNGITFTDDIAIITDNIPVEDYDLCIILGNLLDNAVSACIRSDSYDKSISVQIYIDENNKFVISVKNTFIGQTSSSPDNDTMYHGYGIRNIESLVERYHGMYQVITDTLYKTYIVIPVLEK